jgi:hypothetical protein
MLPPIESDERRRTTSISAVKTGPLGRTILLPTDQVAAYEALADSVNRQFQPDTHQEKLLAQSIVDCEWRLRRISNMEDALYLLGRRELAATHSSEPDPEKRAALIDSQVLVLHRKLFKLLAQQGRYLRKQFKADTAELNQLRRGNSRSKRRGLFLVPKRQES